MTQDRKRIILAGGAGYLGRALAGSLSQAGFSVVVLSRSQGVRFDSPGVSVRIWDGMTLGDWAECLDGAFAVINLTGRSVDCRYNRKNRQIILESRVQPTHLLGEAIVKCAEPPTVWLNSSTATIYKHSFNRPMDEATGEIGGTPEARDEFSVEVACAWEKALAEAPAPGTRKVALRTAMVMGLGRNSAFPNLRKIAMLGLGGAMDGGKQYISWIHERDFCRAIEWLLTHAEFHGPINLAAPNPLPNVEAMRDLRQACGRRFGLPASRWMLEVGAFFLRTETELIIKSRRVLPARLLESGFRFEFNHFAEAVRDLCDAG